MKPHGDQIMRRMFADAVSLEKQSGFEHSPYLQSGQPRWKLGPRWIEFECGCVAERYERLSLPVENYDPVIFENLPEQALYYFVCYWHQPGMFEHRIKFSHRFGVATGYADFNDWARRRRPLLMGAS